MTVSLDSLMAGQAQEVVATVLVVAAALSLATGRVRAWRAVEDQPVGRALDTWGDGLVTAVACITLAVIILVVPAGTWESIIEVG